MSRHEILQILKRSRKGFLSGEAIAERLHISRTAVWKHIRTLEREGFEIEAVPSRGYRLMTEPDVMLAEEIKRGLKARIIGKTVEVLPETASTNTEAMKRAGQGAPEGTVIIAEIQTGGKGRLGRTWISPKGNIYLSVILRPNIPTHKAPLITLMGAVAIASAIRKQFELPAAIKWPNDILIGERKAAGLLTEMSAEPDRVKHIALGVGVNVNMDLQELPAPVRQLSTSLSAEKGEVLDRTQLVQGIIAEIDRWYQFFLKDEAAVLLEWETLNMTIGRRVSVKGLSETIEGRAEALDSEGRLILKLDDGSLRPVAAGDVTIVK